MEKPIGEATAEIEKCIELTEFACSLPQLVTGEVLGSKQRR
jgi:malonate-semialdehyde dehydrogenase (acetylating)/methylmalonate-semialdehyde dehydrogenase